MAVQQSPPRISGGACQVRRPRVSTRVWSSLDWEEAHVRCIRNRYQYRRRECRAAAADFVHARFVVANSAAVGVREAWLPLLDALKGAGAAGRLIGIAAATGLVLFFTGAITTHLRAGLLYNLAFPGFYDASLERG
jgi:hypothetical protein